jgi:hypothetical protein
MSSRRQPPVSFAIPLALTCNIFAQTKQDIPHLEKHGNVIQLYVGQQTFSDARRRSSQFQFFQSGQHASHLAKTVRDEPEHRPGTAVMGTDRTTEGKFDFGLVDGLISDAHANKLYVVLIMIRELEEHLFQLMSPNG